MSASQLDYGDFPGNGACLAELLFFGFSDYLACRYILMHGNHGNSSAMEVGKALLASKAQAQGELEGATQKSWAKAGHVWAVGAKPH